MTFSLGSTPRSLVKYNDKSISAITEVGSGAKDSLVLIKELTASSSATLSFVDGTDDVVLDSTYPIYLFKFISIHPGTDAVEFQFQVNAAGGADYNETITSTMFDAFHDEADTNAGIEYDTTGDKAQATTFQALLRALEGGDNDASASGELYLFNPSSTTFVKHFTARTQSYYNTGYSLDWFTAGYVNTTSAIDEIQFKMASGNIDAGTIKLYGIKDS